MDTIFIRGLKVQAIIGAHNWEQRVARTLVLDLELGADARNAARTDQLADALDYHAISKRVQAICDASRFRLIESLAELVAKTLLAEFRADWLKLTVYKPGAVPAADDVGVRIERKRSDYS